MRWCVAWCWRHAHPHVALYPESLPRGRCCCARNVVVIEARVDADNVWPSRCDHKCHARLHRCLSCCAAKQDHVVVGMLADQVVNTFANSRGQLVIGHPAMMRWPVTFQAFAREAVSNTASRANDRPRTRGVRWDFTGISGRLACDPVCQRSAAKGGQCRVSRGGGVSIEKWFWMDWLGCSEA